MPPDRVSAVLHITAAAGGGADRYVRDVAATTPHRHYVLHVGPAIDVLEDVATREFVPLAGLGSERGASALASWRESAGVGIAHLHGVDRSCRARLAAFHRPAPLPYLVTLHDLGFVNPRAFEAPGMPAPDRTWIAGLAPTLSDAATVIVPSIFLRQVVLDTVPGCRTTVVAPGLRSPPHTPDPTVPADFLAARPRRLVAVVGAVGPHKGSELLDRLAALCEGTDVGLAVIGYTDTRLVRGWAIPGRLYVHGPYQDDALPGWLAAYSPDLVLFPNRLPESFSYTLSEVWAAGLPVIVPDEGALGARVAQLGGGWRLPAGFAAADAAALIFRLCRDEGAPELARVKSAISASDPSRIPALSTMSREIDALYARYAAAATSPTDTGAAQRALGPLLAVNLDGFLFRRELINLASQLEQSETDRDAARQRSSQLEQDAAAWAAKLEGDIATLRGELVSERARLEADLRRATADKARGDKELRRQSERSAALADESTRVTGENRLLADEIARQGEASRRLAEDASRLAESNSTLAADNARQEAELRSLRAGMQALEEARDALAMALRESERREREGERRERESIATVAQVTQEKAALQRDTAAAIERLGEEIRGLASHKAAFDLLPQFMRNYLRNKALRARG